MYSKQKVEDCETLYIVQSQFARIKPWQLFDKEKYRYRYKRPNQEQNQISEIISTFTFQKLLKYTQKQEKTDQCKHYP